MLECCEGAIDLLRSLEKETRIGVISMCGVRNIGKSYLLNCLLDLDVGEEDKRVSVRRRI